jgi:hypothetical protein
MIKFRRNPSGGRSLMGFGVTSMDQIPTREECLRPRHYWHISFDHQGPFKCDSSFASLRKTVEGRRLQSDAEVQQVIRDCFLQADYDLLQERYPPLCVCGIQIISACDDNLTTQNPFLVITLRRVPIHGTGWCITCKPMSPTGKNYCSSTR